MTTPIAGAWSEDSAADVMTPAEAVEFVNTVAEHCYAKDGQRGALTMWWGPPINWQPGDERVHGPLRVDLWGELDRACVRWLPTGHIGFEPDVEPLAEAHDVMGGLEDPMDTVPGSLIRCTLDAARQAVEEYVRTKERPTNLQWTDEGH